MEEQFKKLNKDEYREFENWIRKHNQELYEHKVAYEVRWTDEDYLVRLCDESLYSMSDIMLDIHNKVGYNVPN